MITFIRNILFRKATLRDGRGDGDSFWVVNSNGSEEHVRLYGCDAPEFTQPLGLESTRRRISLLKGQTFSIKRFGKDCYGRSLVRIKLQRVGDIGKVLVREGLAHNTGGYTLAQMRARMAGAGVWGLKCRDRKDPSAYRRNRKAA